MRLFRQTAIIVVLLLSAPLPAFANVGLPMIALALPGMVASLIPIILIESWYFHRSLELPYRQALKVTGIVNLESTLIGIPMAWIVWVLIATVLSFVTYYLGKNFHFVLPEIVGILFTVTIGTASLAPVESDAYWMVPAASFILLIPFFYVSWILERSLARRYLQEYAREGINRAALRANLYSYGLLGVIVLVWLMLSVAKRVSS